MADEGPKDYSLLYNDERPPPIPTGRATNKLHQKLVSLQMDGASQGLRHRELDLKEVVSKLQNHKITLCNSHAKDALSEHYTSFVGSKNNAKFRVLIKYPSNSASKADEIYAVRVHTNTLRAIRDKLPRRGNYRYFFRTHNCLEEVELDDSPVPVYTEKEGYKQINVHLFERTV